MDALGGHCCGHSNDAATAANADASLGGDDASCELRGNPVPFHWVRISWMVRRTLRLTQNALRRSDCTCRVLLRNLSCVELAFDDTDIALCDNRSDGGQC